MQTKLEIKVIFLGADHRGFSLKGQLKTALIKNNFTCEDLGNNILDPSDDYVDFALKVAEAVSHDQINRGLLCCGSANGMVMTANKVPGIRAALAFDIKTAQETRQHQDANVLCLPADKLTFEEALQISLSFLNTPFSNEECHQRRIEKLAEVDRLYKK